MEILMKPHHFLDIIKLYGAGLEKFIPDIERGHDFWKIGNMVLENPDLIFRLTAGNDSICVPCKFNEKEKCIDVVEIDLGEMPKDEFNKAIDGNIFRKLGIEEGAVFSAREFCRLAKEKLGKEDIFEIWNQKSEAETEKRCEMLFAGFEKYLERAGK